MPIPAGSVTSSEYRPPAVAWDDITITLDDWTAGATDSAGTHWSINKLEGWWEAPEPRLSMVERPQDHGAFDGPTTLAPRVITLEGIASSPNRATHLLARDIVASLAWRQDALTAMVVTEPGRPTRRCMVRPSGSAKARDITDTLCAWSLLLVAPDPRRYAETETSLTLSPPTGASGGITVPLTVPFSLSTVGMSTSSGVATNIGTFPTSPVVTLNGPLVDPQIANTTAGRTLSLTITLVAGDSLTLDFDRRTVRLNGTASRSNTLTADAAWWDLAPGGNDIRFAAGGGDGTAVIRWSSAWL